MHKKNEKTFGQLPLTDLKETQWKNWYVVRVAGDSRQFQQPSPSEQTLGEDETSEKDSHEIIDASQSNNSIGLHCGTCSITAFNSLEEQYEHFKSDYHRVNLKRRAKGDEPLSEDDANAKLEARKQKHENSANLDEAISSSDESKSDEEANGIESASKSTEPVVEFSDGISLFKILKNVMPDTDKDDFDPYSSLRQLMQSKHKWAIFLLRSGRFAGAVFDHEKAVTHKTFQRYTTRRKQGGSQSANDASKGAAKSAGATLRRYNEAQLKQDIANVVEEWKPLLDKVEMVFIASSKNDRSTFFNTKTNVLTSSDRRIRRIPFPTYRPTFEEVCRVRSDLSCVRFSPLVDEKLSVAVPSSSPKKKSNKVEEPKVVEPVEEKEQVPPPPIVEKVQQGDVEAVKNMMEKDTSVDVNEPDSDLMTALHHAAAADNSPLVSIFLQAGANPSLKDTHGRPPYFLCSQKETRNIFRRFMADNPEAWDYTESNIPMGLTSEMEKKKKEKEAEKKKRQRERKKLKKKEEAEKRKVEEEQAAERERKVQAERACAFCGKDAGKSPFKRLEFQYCSTECVNNHRRKLMSEAALKRMGN